MLRTKISRPLAIAMRDFSWLERRWSGAGYEDWERALDELQERGYDAVRIDAYPHLVALDAQREWELLPVWNQQDWGSPALTCIQVQPALNQFLEQCHVRGLWVSLSSWFRRDRNNSQMLLEEALTPFKARPHWGKVFHADAAALAPLYPRHSDFVRLVERLDPRGAFRNSWLKAHVLGNQ